MCPNSPAMPLNPLYGLEFKIIPRPIHSLILTHSAWEAPCAAPNACSAIAMMVESLSMKMGI